VLVFVLAALLLIGTLMDGPVLTKRRPAPTASPTPGQPTP
jgi:hypothetical protein